MIFKLEYAPNVHVEDNKSSPFTQTGKRIYKTPKIITKSQAFKKANADTQLIEKDFVSIYVNIIKYSINKNKKV